MKLKRISTDKYISSTALRNMKAAIEFCITQNLAECAVNRMRFRILSNTDGIIRIVQLEFGVWCGTDLTPKWGYTHYNGSDSVQTFSVENSND